MRPWYMKFRWHFAAAPLIGILIAGNPHEVSDPIEEILYVPLLSFLMSWGIWQPPANYLLVLAIFSAVFGLQFAKHRRSSSVRKLAITQISHWWFIWLLFGLAERFGVYCGP
jgi:hypothetical protein